MEIFRGDTFYKKFSPNGYVMQNGDIIRLAILESTLAEEPIYKKEITITEQRENVILEIPKSDMEKLPTGMLVLEIELTYGGGLVRTQQYELDVKVDGIHG